MTANTRVDLHVHPTASQVSRLGVQRALGLPECATPPDVVYELAKRRGMDFVTLTDHRHDTRRATSCSRRRRPPTRGSASWAWASSGSPGGTAAQAILEAQASGLPVVAVGAGGPLELVDSGRSGLLCPPDVEALSAAVVHRARHPAVRERLARGGVAAVRERTWEAALARLASGWRAALGLSSAVRAVA